MAEKSSYTIYAVEEEGTDNERLVLLGEGAGINREEALEDLLTKRNEPEREGTFEASPTRGVKRLRRKISRPVVAAVEEVGAGRPQKPQGGSAPSSPAPTGNGSSKATAGASS